MDAEVRKSPIPTALLLARVWRVVLFAGLLAVVLTGCAKEPPASDPDAVAEFNQTNDPLEPTNRVFFEVNNGIDTVLLKPAAKAYRYVVPSGARASVHNFLTNLGSTVTLSNDIMQGKPRRAGDTSMRFLINTTFGVIGLFDVADGWGYKYHDTDFGLTLGSWGVSDGPFLFLPLLGPSGPRDLAGFAFDAAQDPFTWVGATPGLRAFNWSKFGVTAIDERERYLDATDQINKTALDPYATFRSLYRQHRAGQLRELREDNRATVPVWFPQAQREATPSPAR